MCDKRTSCTDKTGGRTEPVHLEPQHSSPRLLQELRRVTTKTRHMMIQKSFYRMYKKGTKTCDVRQNCTGWWSRGRVTRQLKLYSFQRLYNNTRILRCATKKLNRTWWYIRLSTYRYLNSFYLLFASAIRNKNWRNKSSSSCHVFHVIIYQDNNLEEQS